MLEHPPTTDPRAWIETQVGQWGVHLLRTAGYKPKTSRTWLSRAGRFLDTLATPLSAENLQDAEQLAMALRTAIATRSSH